MFESNVKGYMSVAQIRRDFSDIICNEGNFEGLNLQGMIFRNAQLNATSFDGCDLTDADFTGAKVKWSSFKNAKLIRTNFSNADLSYSYFNDAIVTGAIFRGTNVSYCIFFHVNRYSADFTDANTYEVAWNESELDEETHKRAMRKMIHAGFSPETKQIIKKNVKPLQAIINLFKNIGNKITSALGYESHVSRYSEQSIGIEESSLATYGTRREGSNVAQYGKRTAYQNREEKY